MIAGLAYDLSLLFWRLVINIFFREVSPVGALNIPEHGPVLFICAPHSNQFLDPILLFSEVWKEGHRRVAVLTAAKSMSLKFVGALARVMDSLPVARAADYAIPGKGRIVTSASNPHIVTGIDTRFTTEIRSRFQLVLPKSAGYASATVEKVISDTEIQLKSEFVVPGTVGNISVKASRMVRTESVDEDGSEYKILPHVEQEQTYRAVFERLNQGGCIGIFPEGGSHDRTELLPLKAGFSIMALGAMDAHPNLRVQLIPVGLSYFHPQKFRSRAVIEFGAPIIADQSLVDMYKAGGGKKREACGKILEQVQNGLRVVTLRGPDEETMQVIQAARRRFRTPGQYLTLGQVIRLNKRIMAGYLYDQQQPKIIELRNRVVAYNKSLRVLGIADHQVERASNKSVRSGLLLIYRIGVFLSWSMLSLPGAILHAPVLILAKTISQKMAKEAVAASTMKIRGGDVIATWKVLVSLVVVPLLYVFYAFIATIYVYHHNILPEYRKYTPLLVIWLLPSLGYSALKFGEAGMDIAKSLRPLFLALWPHDQREVKRLRQVREELSKEIGECIDEFGPQLYENFSKSRTFASASVPQTGPL